MVITYLSNYKQELVEKRIDLLKSFQKMQLLIKENKELKHFIEKSQDKSYDSFSPQNYKYNINEKRIQELEEQKVELEANSKQLELEINDIETQIQELDNIIRSVKQDSRKVKDLEKELNNREFFRLKMLENQEYERQRIMNAFQNSTVEHLINVLYKMELCTKLAEVDIKRCKLELECIEKEIRKTIQNIKEVADDICPIPINNIFNAHIVLKNAVTVSEFTEETPTAYTAGEEQNDISSGKILERELKRLRKKSDIKVSYKIIGDVIEISEITLSTIIRIIKDAYFNIINNTNAKRMNIRIKYEEDIIKIKITDDGIKDNNTEEKNNQIKIENDEFEKDNIESESEIMVTNIMDENSNKGEIRVADDKYETEENIGITNNEYEIEEHTGKIDGECEIEEHTGKIDGEYEIEEHTGITNDEYETEEHIGKIDSEYELKENLGITNNKYEIEEHTGIIDGECEIEEHTGKIDGEYEIEESEKSVRKKLLDNENELKRDTGIDNEYEENNTEDINNMNYNLSMIYEKVYLLSGDIKEVEKNKKRKMYINIPIS